MTRLALAFNTKDRPELSRRTIQPLLGHPGVSIYWCDGSTTEEGQRLPGEIQLQAGEHHHIYHHSGVTGGADAAIVYALSTMLKGPHYEYVGLVENDVLLQDGWLAASLDLFSRGRADGLAVGAVSARCYEDRILFQRDGYAVMHNLGAGQVIFTREAARLILDHFRTTFTIENRKVFAQLSGVDIGSYWAFRTAERFLTADWGFDKVLAAHGLASLALTPSPCDMLDRGDESVGLKIVHEPVESYRREPDFCVYRNNLARIRGGTWQPRCPDLFELPQGTTVFPHQLPMIGGRYDGDWRLKWQQGFGPFAYRAGEKTCFKEAESTDEYAAKATLTVPVLGPCAFLVGGGPTGGQVEVIDEQSGYRVIPALAPEGGQTSVLSIEVPGGITYRGVRLRMLSPGATFYGLQVRDAQPYHSCKLFEHEDLPPV